LWEVLPTDKQVKPVVRWDAHVNDIVDRAPWARLINGNIVVQQSSGTGVPNASGVPNAPEPNLPGPRHGAVPRPGGMGHGHELMAWDAAGKKMLYRTEQKSFLAPSPTLSGGRRYLFIPEDHQVRVLEAATGETLLTLPASRMGTTAVTDDGRRVAVLDEDKLTVWNLTDSSVKPQSYEARAIGAMFPAPGAPLNWIGDDRVMVTNSAGHLVLISLPHKMPIWTYEFDLSAHVSSREQRGREIAAGYLVYSASARKGFQTLMAIGAVALPGPNVDEVVASFDPESLVVLKPGMAVRVEVKAGDNNARIEASLKRKIQANGWKLDPAATIVVTAEMTRGETQQIKYRKLGVPGPSSEETITVTPEFSIVSVKVNGKPVWIAATGIPPFIEVPQGKTLQDEIDYYQKPNVEFFDRVEIPDRIRDPDKIANGLGTTKITTRGLVPK